MKRVYIFVLCIAILIMATMSAYAATPHEMYENGAVSDEGIPHGDVRDGIVSDESNGEKLFGDGGMIDDEMNKLMPRTKDGTVTDSTTAADANNASNDSSSGIAAGILIAVIVVIAVVVVIFLVMPKRK